MGGDGARIQNPITDTPLRHSSPLKHGTHLQHAFETLSNSPHSSSPPFQGHLPYINPARVKEFVILSTFPREKNKQVILFFLCSTIFHITELLWVFDTYHYLLRAVSTIFSIKKVNLSGAMGDGSEIVRELLTSWHLPEDVADLIISKSELSFFFS